MEEDEPRRLIRPPAKPGLAIHHVFANDRVPGPTLARGKTQLETESTDASLPGRGQRRRRPRAADPDPPRLRAPAGRHHPRRQDRPRPGRRPRAPAPRHRRPALPGPRLPAPRDPHAVVNDPDWLARGSTYVANARWVPPARFTPPDDSAPWLGTCEGRPACRPGRPRGGRRPAPRLGRRLVRRPGDAAAPRRAGGDLDRPPLGPGHPQRRPARARLRGRGPPRHQQPPPGHRRRRRPGAAPVRSTRRRGSTPTRSSTPPAGRSPSRPAPGSSRSRGSRGPATSAATRTSSAPTCAAG